LFNVTMHHFLSNLQYLLTQHSDRVEKLATRDVNQILNHNTPPTLEDVVRISNEFGIPLDTLVNTDLKNRETVKNNEINVLFMDVDGVLTDGGMYYSEKGDELKKFNTRDGMAMKILVKKGFQLGFISSGFNQQLIESRAKLLGVSRVYAGDGSKVTVMEKWCRDLNVKPANIAYIGDDINDLPVIEKAGLSACPSDASMQVKKSVDVILQTKGGEGCVREFAEKYLL
jgi:3-deoxy-D-manno-octulosonate 8-phosphate phosphatase (KDO 8-P phosphatase)